MFGGTSAILPNVHVVALVKQIPEFEHMALGADGRLDRTGVPLEMSAYDRRAVAKGVELARATDGRCTVVTLGPETAVDVLREALAYGADDSVHICDPAFAGSDTLATARALAAALRLVGPFDLVLVGRNSVDADTGQVGPELAQLLDLPFATGVKQLDVLDGVADVALELDDERVEASVALPAVLSTAERLIDPCKIKDPAQWDGVDPTRIRRLTAAELGSGPWGQAGSPTSVGETRAELVDRLRRVASGPMAEQVRHAVELLKDRGVLLPVGAGEPGAEVAPATSGAGGAPAVAVIAEPSRARSLRELLGGAARLAGQLGGRVVVLGTELDEATTLSSWGADAAVDITATDATSALVEEDVAGAAATWIAEWRPAVVLTGSTAWGREVASRVAASLGAGLTGDAVGLTVEQGRLVAWKPAFGGTLVAAITSSSDAQMATVRPGVLPLLRPRPATAIEVHEVQVEPRRRVVVHRREREDDIDALAHADVVIGVGAGVDPGDYHHVEPLRTLLGAELAATRKVTDKGWMPHARQIGITGHAISPRLYLALGTSGKYNHTVGVRSAGTVIAVNPDPAAPVFGFADVGIVGDWHEAVDELERQLRPLVS